MSEPTLDDLRVKQETCGRSLGCGAIHGRPLTPAEFDRIATEQGYVKETALVKRALDIFYEGGWVKRPVCDVLGCVDGFIFEGDDGDIPCPSCDGTGFGMRHFVRGAYHWAGHFGGKADPFWTELEEGPDGKCDWCRAADEAREKYGEGAEPRQ